MPSSLEPAVPITLVPETSDSKPNGILLVSRGHCADMANVVAVPVRTRSAGPEPSMFAFAEAMRRRAKRLALPLRHPA
jgi:hypothetical protein